MLLDDGNAGKFRAYAYTREIPLLFPPQIRALQSCERIGRQIFAFVFLLPARFTFPVERVLRLVEAVFHDRGR